MWSKNPKGISIFSENNIKKQAQRWKERWMTFGGISGVAEFWEWEAEGGDDDGGGGDAIFLFLWFMHVHVKFMS